MDEQTYSRTLSYVVCELTMPVKRHVYNFAVENQGSLNHHLLTAAVKAVEQNKDTKAQNVSLERLSDFNLSSNGSLLTNDNHYKASQITVPEDIMPGEETSLEDMGLKEEFNGTFKTELPEVKGGTAFESDKLNFSTSSFPHSDRSNTNSECEASIENNIQNEDEINDEERGTTVGANMNCDIDNENIQSDNNSDSIDDMSSFYSDPLLLCSDADFNNMFRISRIAYQNLLEFLSKEEMEPIDNVPLYKKLLIVLWLIGNSGSFSDAADMFEVAEQTIENCFFDVCATLYNKCDSVIRWPNSEERYEISSRIEQTYGVPEVVGVLGCSYFTISIPKEALSRREHFNAKTRTYCVSLQIVCDDRLVIRDIFPGLPGSKPAAQVLRDSPLCAQLMSKAEPRLVESHRHLLARKEYPQLTSMLTPYVSKEGASLTKEEEEFNSLHEDVCVLLDNTFGLLRDRFLTLKLLDPEVATMVLVSACVLHNICIESGDTCVTID